MQRARLTQAGLAMLLLAAGVAGMHYFGWVGGRRLRPVLAWSAATLAGHGGVLRPHPQRRSRRGPNPR